MGNTELIYAALGATLAVAGVAVMVVGYARSKTAGHSSVLLAVVLWIGVLLQWAVGSGFAYGDSASGLVGTTGFFSLGTGVPMGSASAWWFYTMLAVFAGTVAVSGMLGRTRFGASMIVILVTMGVIVPVVQHWVWHPNGWLHSLGFRDFGGAAAIHILGGAAALGATRAVGPRIGRYSREGLPNALPAHNLPMSAVGFWLLTIGWLGLLMGRGTQVSNIVGVPTPPLAEIAVVALLGQSAGALAAMSFAWGRFGKPDVALILNGAVAGTVAVVAAADRLNPLAGVIVGGVGGFLSVLGTQWSDRLQLDDVGGVVPVHGLAGVWGCLVAGLLVPSEGLLMGGGSRLLVAQVIGIAAVAAAGAGAMWLTCTILSRFAGLRVSRDDELEGLDHVEHSNEAYPDFQRAEFK
ncbi:ammonium transporter [Candidatus Poribacteria bacterium]|nr:ammonium transporter [Candidatus Poribacteria bacterium]